MWGERARGGARTASAAMHARASCSSCCTRPPHAAAPPAPSPSRLPAPVTGPAPLLRPSCPSGPSPAHHLIRSPLPTGPPPSGPGCKGPGRVGLAARVHAGALVAPRAVRVVLQRHVRSLHGPAARQGEPPRGAGRRRAGGPAERARARQLGAVRTISSCHTSGPRLPAPACLACRPSLLASSTSAPPTPLPLPLPLPVRYTLTLLLCYTVPYHLAGGRSAGARGPRVGGRGGYAAGGAARARAG